MEITSPELPSPTLDAQVPAFIVTRFLIPGDQPTLKRSEVLSKMLVPARYRLARRVVDMMGPWNSFKFWKSEGIWRDLSSPP